MPAAMADWCASPRENGVGLLPTHVQLSPPELVRVAFRGVASSTQMHPVADGGSAGPLSAAACNVTLPAPENWLQVTVSCSSEAAAEKFNV